MFSNYFKSIAFYQAKFCDKLLGPKIQYTSTQSNCELCLSNYSFVERENQLVKVY